jgi:glycerol-3-phosphate dehydrogenase (NAD(P)+)
MGFEGTESMKVGVLGAGSFGTALAIYAANNGFDVDLWARRQEFVEDSQEGRSNERYLPGIPFPDRLRVTGDLARLADSDFLIMAVPSHGFRHVLREFLEVYPRGRRLKLISATKGIETEHLARMSQVSFEEGAKADRELCFAVLSGPSFAAELATGMPTAAVIASEDGDLAREIQEHLSTGSLRLYTSADVPGVELGGAAKNVVAIAAGVLTGVGLGHNTLAALITRGLHEMTRLGFAYGGKPRTFSGLAGLGDLVLTCTGGLSRNRRAGLALAEGKSLPVMEEETGMVAEGMRNSLAIVRLARRKGVEMPIAEQMAAVIYEGRDPGDAVRQLMMRDLKSEAEL